MSSMTEEERKEYELLANHCIVTSIGFIHLEVVPLIDWLNANHFDYRNLISKNPLDIIEAITKSESKSVIIAQLNEMELTPDIQEGVLLTMIFTPAFLFFRMYITPGFAKSVAPTTAFIPNGACSTSGLSLI